MVFINRAATSLIHVQRDSQSPTPHFCLKPLFERQTSAAWDISIWSVASLSALDPFSYLSCSLVSLAGIHNKQQQFQIGPTLQLWTVSIQHTYPSPSGLFLTLCSCHGIAVINCGVKSENPTSLFLDHVKSRCQQCPDVHSLCMMKLHGSSCTLRLVI